MLRESKRGTAAKAQQPTLWKEAVETLGLIIEPSLPLDLNGVH